MGRANNKCSSCSFKVQQIFRSVIGIHHKSCNILILNCNLFFNQILMLNMGEPILGYLNSHPFGAMFGYSLKRWLASTFGPAGFARPFRRLLEGSLVPGQANA